MGSPGYMDDGIEQDTEVEGVIESFVNPSTFPHIVTLILSTAILYLMMKIKLFGMDELGSIIFLSLAITYILAAIINPSKIGKFLLNVNHDSAGIFNLQYWVKSAKVMSAIALTCLTLTVLLASQLGENRSNVIFFMSSIFLLMSIGQAVSITAGGINYSNGRKLKPRESKTGRLATTSRTIIIILAFSPLVWWFGYTSGQTAQEITYVNLNWMLQFVFIICLGLIVILADKMTREKRRSESIDGRAVDRFMMFIIATCCWHLFSAWRRNPFIQNPNENAILVEEGFLMAITIILAVWSISNRGKKKGWRIFQGQSAIFWGVAFGYTYGGSVASLSSISGGYLDMVSITALGHLITAFSIIVMLPLSIGLVGIVKKIETSSKEKFEEISKIYNPEKGVEKENNSDDEDTVELLD